ncbi:MAG: HNH endonuclease [Patescibacteria group bacterium]
MKKPNYKIYATLLDKFQSYLDSSEIYQQFWGFSENAEKTEEQFEQEQFQSLIDSINRVPFDSEAADKGTAFNEVVDCLIEHRKSEKMDIKSDKENGIVCVDFNNRHFEFSLNLCLEFSEYFKGALTQQRVTGLVNTKYGIVEVYGITDELMPDKVHDIKTTSKYHAFKYKNNWQHIVYPFCLLQAGYNIYEFEYDITDFKNTYKESYTFIPEIHISKLTLVLENFIEFLELNKEFITDKKIFNMQ